MSPNLVQKQKIPSTHSEGYFSSEDDTKRKTDSLTEKLKQLSNFFPLIKIKSLDFDTINYVIGML